MMRSIKNSLKLTLCLIPLALTACEGWVPVYTSDIFPYGNKRTAGSGVMYVRESMLPAKELKVEVPEEAVKEEVNPVEAEPEVEDALEEMVTDEAHDAFMDAQAK
jgi:hypothetical protein